MHKGKITSSVLGLLLPIQTMALNLQGNPAFPPQNYCLDGAELVGGTALCSASFLPCLGTLRLLLTSQAWQIQVHRWALSLLTVKKMPRVILSPCEGFQYHAAHALQLSSLCAHCAQAAELGSHTEPRRHRSVAFSPRLRGLPPSVLLGGDTVLHLTPQSWHRFLWGAPQQWPFQANLPSMTSSGHSSRSGD